MRSKLSFCWNIPRTNKFAALLFAVLTAGCDFSTPSTFPMIKTAGIYDLDPTPYEVSVQVRNRLVVIAIKDANGVVVVKDDDASNVHRWFLYWDETTQRLWRYSSDVGTVVWDLAGSEQVVEEHVTPKTTELIQAIPREVYADLPESLKQFWAKSGARERAQ